MQALRWIIGIITALGAAGFLALVVFGDGFRRSYGASENGLFKVGVTLVIQAALLASIAAPNQRLLLHSVAVVVVSLIAGCLWIYRESAFVGTTGLAYCGMWLGYYWQAVWGQR
jgi:hypothetical protein